MGALFFVSELPLYTMLYRRLAEKGTPRENQKRPATRPRNTRTHMHATVVHNVLRGHLHHERTPPPRTLR